MAANLERAALRTLNTCSRHPSRWKIGHVELQCRRTISSTASLRRDINVSPQERAREELVVKRLTELMRLQYDGDVDSSGAVNTADSVEVATAPDPRMENYYNMITSQMDKGQDPWDHPDNEEEPDKPNELGFWAEGEPDAGPDDDYHGDDISSIAHTELDTHREMREYARLAAWELPLLSKLAQPFELPTQPLRFRYTTYLGDTHPAAHKVVLEFSPRDLPNMTKAQAHTLIKLSGPRYNPDKQVVKMSCEQFDTQMQNKRWLLDTVNALIKEAKEGKDKFEDVPLDFRHHKSKPKYEFPQEWVMTGERRAQLESKRAAALQMEQKLLLEGKILDGKKIVNDAISPGKELDLATVEAPIWYSGRRRFRR